jgi:hypothetical protein
MISTSGSSGIVSRAAEDLTVGRLVESNDQSPASSKSGSAEITAGSQQQAGQHIRFVFTRVELDVNDPLAFGDVNLVHVSIILRTSFHLSGVFLASTTDPVSTLLAARNSCVFLQVVQPG